MDIEIQRERSAQFHRKLLTCLKTSKESSIKLNYFKYRPNVKISLFSLHFRKLDWERVGLGEGWIGRGLDWERVRLGEGWIRRGLY